jgi:hypothetical protein
LGCFGSVVVVCTLGVAGVVIDIGVAGVIVVVVGFGTRKWWWLRHVDWEMQSATELRRVRGKIVIVGGLYGRFGLSEGKRVSVCFMAVCGLLHGKVE